MRGNKIYVLSMALIFCASKCLAAEKYPEISPIGKSTLIDSENPAFDLVVRSPEKEDLYKLVCRSGEHEGNDYGYFSGFFQCKLLDIQTGEDIFRPAADWDRSWTRGRFYIYSIIGGCKNHLEYGHVRTFAARGMKIRIDIHDLIPKESMASLFEKYRFMLDVSIRSEPMEQNPYVGYEKEICISNYERIDSDGKFIDDAKIIKYRNE